MSATRRSDADAPPPRQTGKPANETSGLQKPEEDAGAQPTEEPTKIQSTDSAPDRDPVIDPAVAVGLVPEQVPIPGHDDPPATVVDGVPAAVVALVVDIHIPVAVEPASRASIIEAAVEPVAAATVPPQPTTPNAPEPVVEIDVPSSERPLAGPLGTTKEQVAQPTTNGHGPTTSGPTTAGNIKGDGSQASQASPPTPSATAVEPEPGPVVRNPIAAGDSDTADRRAPSPDSIKNTPVKVATEEQKTAVPKPADPPTHRPLDMQIADSARNGPLPSDGFQGNNTQPDLQANGPQPHMERVAMTTASPARAMTPAVVAAASTFAGLAVEIAARANAGHSRFEIRLDPPELGRVDVRLDIDRHGHATSRLVVERAETFELLRRDAAHLERSLEQAGLKLADNALQFALRDQAFGGRDGDAESGANASLVVPDEALAATEATAGGYGRLPRSGGIDIRV